LTESTDATSGEQAYFLVLYMLYFTFVVSGTQIPYDALGQELAENYDDRAKLFTVKPIFNLVGLGIGSQVLATIMSAYPQDYAFACFLCFAVLSSVFALTYLLVMCGVHERPLSARTELPFTSSLMRLLANDKYRIYLVMRIPMTVLGLLPAQVFLYYLQNNLSVEVAGTLYGNVLIVALAGAIISSPLMTYCSGRFGRPATLTACLGGVGSLFFVAFFVPFDQLPALIYVVAPFLGLCLSLPYVVPDSMLGDIIDYDELLHGQRNEAMFSMVETNVQQLVEVILGAATMSMALAGFSNLGGCECGCGVSCDQAFGYVRRAGALARPLLPMPSPLSCRRLSLPMRSPSLWRLSCRRLPPLALPPRPPASLPMPSSRSLTGLPLDGLAALCPLGVPRLCRLLVRPVGWRQWDDWIAVAFPARARRGTVRGAEQRRAMGDGALHVWHPGRVRAPCNLSDPAGGHHLRAARCHPRRHRCAQARSERACRRPTHRRPTQAPSRNHGEHALRAVQRVGADASAARPAATERLPRWPPRPVQRRHHRLHHCHGRRVLRLTAASLPVGARLPHRPRAI